VVAADGALTLGATDRLIEITGTAGGTIAATMTATHAGHCVRVRMRAGDGTHHYTLAAKYNGSAGTVLMNAANELVDLYYDGSAWNVAFLSGATWS
jgi:hypothetical protein